MKQERHIYMIAGEASGDFLGSELMKAIRAKLGDTPVHFHGIGGDRMIDQGLGSLFAFHELSLMGFAEVLPHIFRLKARIRETASDVIRVKPDVIITIDSPGFTYRVVKMLRKLNMYHRDYIHYVAPTVWAYKPERALKTANLFDHLIVLLPFEPAYFTPHGLATDFVGHSVAWDWKQRGDNDAFRKRHNIPAEAMVLGMMPGSRVNEITRHLEIFYQTALKLKHYYPDMHIVLPARPNLAKALHAAANEWAIPTHVIEGDGEKKDAFSACNLALAKSGTVSLETALAGIPTVTAYRANPISIWLARRMVKTKYVNLANIILGEEVIPEMIQEKCNPDALFKALYHLITDETARNKQLQGAKEVAVQLGCEDKVSPSEKAADIVIQHLA